MERIPLEPRLPSEANQSKGQSREITTTLQTESTGEGALLVRGGEPEEQQETSAANGSDESDKEGGDWFEIYIEYPSDVPGVAEAKDTEPVEDEDESDEGEEEGRAQGSSRGCGEAAGVLDTTEIRFSVCRAINWKLLSRRALHKMIYEFKGRFYSSSSRSLECQDLAKKLNIYPRYLLIR